MSKDNNQLCYPIDYVPYCLPGMPQQIIFTQMPGMPLFVPPMCCPCPSACCDPCAKNGNGNGRNGCNGNGSNGKRDGLQDRR